MRDMTAANKARQNKALDTFYNFSRFGITTYRQLIKEGKIIRAEIGKRTSVKWNRVKYNRMGWDEQKEYEKKLEKLLPEYRLYTAESIYHEVPKLVYDYYLEVSDTDNLQRLVKPCSVQ